MPKQLDKGSVFLSNLVHYRTYAATKKDGFKEDKFEMFTRVEKMHLQKYPHIEDEIHSAFDYVYGGLTLPSMRSCQFAGEPIFKENSRMMNCSFLVVKNFQSFAETLFLLCCGTGVGFSVQQCHIQKLPVIQAGYESYHKISDSKEGWADSLLKLLFNPKIEFDYSLIRQQGAILSTGGTASGSGPLRDCHEKMRVILFNARNRRLTSVECADIICHIADGVVVGGARRSATLCLFDWFDDEMLAYKRGNWWEVNSQRARANISAAIYRKDKNAKKAFNKVLDNCFDNHTGEPGIYWTNDAEYIVGTNPCLPNYATVLTPKGIRELKEIDIGDTIWSGNKWTKVTNKWSTGMKDVYKYETTMGRFIGTENHRILENGIKTEVQHATAIDIVKGTAPMTYCFDIQAIMDGMVIGDGTVHKASNNLVLLLIGEDDQDYFNSEISHLILRERNKVTPKGYEIQTNIDYSELPRLPVREIPERYFKGNQKTVISFLRGLFTANGSIVSNRITLKSSCKKLIEQVQDMLSSVGIESYITTNKKTKVKFSNGEYECKESYDLNITRDKHIFIFKIGFIQKYKTEQLIAMKANKQVKQTKKIVSKTFLENTEVFDITVDCEEHAFWSGCCHTSNCGEASLRDNEFCNLTSTNVAGCKDIAEYLKAVEAATIIGTLQAGYDKFGYLNPQWYKNVNESRLLGVSMTGIAEAWDILSPEVLAEGANVINTTNERIAKKIGINTAARKGCIKPEGTGSASLGVSSGITAHIDEYYWRRVRIDKNQVISQYLLKMLPAAFIEQDVMIPNNLVVNIPIAKPGSLTSKKESAIELLEREKRLYKYWILPSHSSGLNTHNISITVNYKPEEKQEIKEWMWLNKDYYAGIALFPSSDTTYAQLPFESMTESNYNEIITQLPEVNLADVNYLNINEERKHEISCGGGSCEMTSL